MLVCILGAAGIENVDLDALFPKDILAETTEIMTPVKDDLFLCVWRWAKRHGFSVHGELPDVIWSSKDTFMQTREKMVDYCPYTVFIHDRKDPVISYLLRYAERYSSFYWVICVRKEDGKWVDETAGCKNHLRTDFYF